MGERKQKKDFKLEDVPEEVMKVWAIKFTNQSIGLELYREVYRIIKKYPEWFKTLIKIFFAIRNES